MPDLTPEEMAEGWASPIPPLERERVRQVFRYLAAHWPAPIPVRLFIRRLALRHQNVAQLTASADGRTLILEIDARACFFHAVDVLMHEYAHAVTWRVRGSDHGAAWAGTFAAMVTAFEDGGADEESKTW
jgi:hypothetical protein